MSGLSEKKLELANHLISDFPFYAEQCLKIRTKSGGIESLVLNTAQAHLNTVAERQLRDRGYVRIIGLKGRQQGFSTYVQGRIYWKTSSNKGKRAFILTHDGEATKSLFEMAERYHTNNSPLLRPELGASNTKEMEFPNLDSGYRIGTAGNKETGRSQTLQYLHGSEVAFWQNAARLARGLQQAVPSGSDAKGTEIWLESTSDGPNNYFHSEWQKAVGGESDFEAVFIPWFWQAEYIDKWQPEWEMDKEEDQLSIKFGLSDEQLAWRRKKIRELGEVDTQTGLVSISLGTDAFKREYPNTPEEAFAMPSGAEFKLDDIRYYNNQISGTGMNVFILVDPAGKATIAERLKKADFTAMIVIGLASDKNYYLLDIIRDKLNPTQRVDTLMTLHRKWAGLSGKSPSVGYESYGIQSDLHYLEKAQEEQTYRFRVVELGGIRSKEERIRRMIPVIENHLLWIPRSINYKTVSGVNVDLIHDFLNNELLVFPRSKHDDVLDAMSRIMDDDMRAMFPSAATNTPRNDTATGGWESL